MTLPKLKDFKLYEPIPDAPGTNFDFKGTYTDGAGDTHNVTVFDTDYFVKNVVQLFKDRIITLPEENTQAAFKALFDTWKASRSELYFKQAYAYTLKYNPIENYSSTEQMIDDETVHEKGASFKDDYHNTDTDTLTPFTKETTETTPYTKVTEETTPYTSETTTTTPYTSETTTTTGVDGSQAPNNETKNSKMAFNSTNWVDTEKSVTNISTQEQLVKDGTEEVQLIKAGTEKQETTWTGTTKTELTKTGTEEHEIAHTGYIEHTTDGSDTDTRNYTLTKKGNIGVMTPAEMLKKEFDGLMQDLAWRALTEFIDRYTYYCVSVE